MQKVIKVILITIILVIALIVSSAFYIDMISPWIYLAIMIPLVFLGYFIIKIKEKSTVKDNIEVNYQNENQSKEVAEVINSTNNYYFEHDEKLNLTPENLDNIINNIKDNNISYIKNEKLASALIYNTKSPEYSDIGNVNINYLFKRNNYIRLSIVLYDSNIDFIKRRKVAELFNKANIPLLVLQNKDYPKNELLKSINLLLGK